MLELFDGGDDAGQGPAEPVEGDDGDGVAVAGVVEQGGEAGSVLAGAGHRVVKDPLDAGRGRGRRVAGRGIGGRWRRGRSRGWPSGGPEDVDAAVGGGGGVVVAAVVEFAPGLVPVDAAQRPLRERGRGGAGVEVVGELFGVVGFGVVFAAVGVAEVVQGGVVGADVVAVRRVGGDRVAVVGKFADQAGELGGFGR